jgi:hypothetical protein
MASVATVLSLAVTTFRAWLAIRELALKGYPESVIG